MIATIAKRFTFDAAHHLPTVPENHKCHRMHGHTYEVEIVISGAVGKDGFVVDYAKLSAMWAPLHHELDHRVLNDVAGLEVPSTEHLAAWICIRIGAELRRLPETARLSITLDKVIVHESTTTWCEVRPHDVPIAESKWLAPGLIVP